MRDGYRDAVQEKIIHSAVNILQNKGIEQVTIRSIAQSLGFSVGSIYTYFCDKTAILRAIYTQTCKDFLRALEAAPQDPSRPEDSFVSLIVLASDFRIRNSYRYREIFQNGLVEKEHEDLKSIREYIFLRLSNLRLPALSTPASLDQAGKIILALCEGFASISSLKEIDKPNEMTAFAVRTLLSGWKMQNHEAI